MRAYQEQKDGKHCGQQLAAANDSRNLDKTTHKAILLDFPLDFRERMRPAYRFRVNRVDRKQKRPHDSSPEWYKNGV